MPRPTSPRMILARTVLATVLVSALAAAVGLWLTRTAAETEALREATIRPNLIADTVVTQALESGLYSEEEDLTIPAGEELRAEVATVLDGIWLVSANLWTEDGRVLWSADPGLVDRRFTTPPRGDPALGYPRSAVPATDLSRPENAALRNKGELVEVHRWLEAPSGEPVLLQVFVNENTVEVRTDELWMPLSAPLLGVMLALAAVLLPLLWVVLRRGHRQREDLLRRNITALREERHRVAGRVHDGPVQDLSAALLALDGLAARASGAGDPSLGDDLRTVAEQVRRAGEDQRTLLDDLYPPEFTRSAFMRTIDDAAGPVRAAAISIDVKVSANAVAAIAPGEQELIRRLIGEALRNIARHSNATTAQVRLDVEGPDVVLEITDDGTGFDPDRLQEPESGHLGTRVLRDLAREAGAQLLLRTAPGAGTSWRLTLAARFD
ncbi:MAG: sensor histidine kinase [Dermatophilaceae bacterium]